MWNHKPSDRLHEWKQFRKQVGLVDVQEAVSKISHLWSYAPYVNHYLDADNTAEWPDPWTLVHENCYCDLAKALGMFYTLYLSPHYGNDIKRLEIQIYKNPTDADVHNTVWIDDGKYILNLEFDTVVNKTQVEEKLILLHCYTVQDLQLNLY